MMDKNVKAIVCFGDSITAGFGEVPHKGWVGRLKDEVENNPDSPHVYNLGVNAENSEGLLQHLEGDLQSRLRFKKGNEKYFVLLSVTINDSKWKGLPKDNNPFSSEETFQERLEHIMKKILNTKSTLLVIGSFLINDAKLQPYNETTSYTNERAQTFNTLAKTVCEKNAIPFLDWKEVQIENIDSLLEDGLHPNSEGHDFMFEQIKVFIEKENGFSEI